MKVLELDKLTEAELNSGRKLPIMEQFYTVQGEGAHTGKAAYFIRIGGCDVGCHWCDVKESWDASIHPLVEVDEVVKNAASYPAKTVVITGGEPLTFNLGYLTQKLKEAGLQVHLETSGAHPFSGQFDWICLSPKKTAPPKPDYYKLANELKVIVYNRHDFDWAIEHAAQVSEQCLLYLQPEWSKREQIMPQIVDFVMNNPSWNISLQSHKYMNIP
ncbi:MAG: 7-carboxy-7-deazaguanine synthase QueE [Flavobacteriales bacterium]|nr:7-carboxy-7-deazaguanine synthase QueE [Flavobacteriales bacterium]MCB9204432.1 7-carboxy-7-deazaguanine synthase QueE [Flavobacteriales bacterium]